MNHRNEDKLQKLEQFLCDVEHQNKEDALAELASNGIDVDKFRSRVASIVRKGYQRQVRLAAEAAATEAQAAKSSLFGDLTLKTKAELLAIREQVVSGVFGAMLQKTAIARCRNHQGEEVSEEELRSWLEDISASAPKE